MAAQAEGWVSAGIFPAWECEPGSAQAFHTGSVLAIRYTWPWPCSAAPTRLPFCDAKSCSSRASVPYSPTPALACEGHPQGRGPARALEVSWSQPGLWSQRAGFSGAVVICSPYPGTS